MDRLGYAGHATTLLRLDGTSVLTDPLFRRWLGPLRRHAPPVGSEFLGAPDAVLISHLHRDHLDLGSLRRLSSKIPVIVPRGAGVLAAKAGGDDIREIGVRETISVGTLTVTAVSALHDPRRGRRGPRADPLGYVIASDRRRAYFAGDTDLVDEMGELGPLDLALLPIWGWGLSLGPGHLDPAGAVQALKLIRPRVAVPIHWGTLYPVGLARIRPDRLTQPPIEFARLAAEATPEVKVRVLRPGEDMAL